MKKNTNTSLLQCFSSPQVKLGLLAFISVNLFGSVLRYYVEISPVLALVPFIVYSTTILLVLIVKFSASHDRLLLTHAYITLPLVIPLSFPLSSGIFIYVSCLVVLFFNVLIYHGEMRKQCEHISSFSRCLFIILGAGVAGAGLAYLLASYVPFKSVPFMLSVAAGCMFRAKIQEISFPKREKIVFAKELLYKPIVGIPTDSAEKLRVLVKNTVAKYKIVTTITHAFTSCYHQLMQIRHVQSIIAESALIQSIPKQYHKTVMLTAFALLLMLLGKTYHYIIAFSGTSQEYWGVLYVTVFCLMVVYSCFLFHRTPLYFGVSIAVATSVNMLLMEKFRVLERGFSVGGMELSTEILMLLSSILLAASIKSPVLFSISSRYGPLQVVHNRRKNTIVLQSSNVIQGAQLCAKDERMEPISYYVKQGPFGQLFGALQNDPRSKNVAVIGLGVGTIAAYGVPGQTMTFYEIDPIVEKIACQMGYFTYVRDSKATVNVVIGDARETIAALPDKSVGVLICDAYTGDNVPRHLLTREAFAIYMSKLEEHGLLVMDITNTKMKLLKIVEKVAADAGLTGFYYDYSPAKPTGLFMVEQEKEQGGFIPKKKSLIRQTDPRITALLNKLEEFFIATGITPYNQNLANRATWAVLARSKEDLQLITHDSRWKPFSLTPNTVLLTDEVCGYDPWERLMVSKI